MGAGVVGVERGRSSVGRNHHFHRLVLVSYHLRLVEQDKKTFGMKNKLKHTKEKKPSFPLFRCRVIYVWKFKTQNGEVVSHVTCVWVV